MDSVARTAVERVEQAGIIFIDEIDKIAGREGGHGPDVSREGVQRDILPIVEGTTVNTKYGMVRTDHILFIAAGAFHVSKPSDLIPELQGRFPIRVELEALGKDEFVRILTEPRSALVKQYIGADGDRGHRRSTFTDEAIHRIADFATIVNERTENIGARRLHTVMEKLLDEISFEGPDLRDKRVIIDEAYVDADARRHRQERRPLPVHPVKCRRRSAGAARCPASGPALRRRRAVGCGKKGPPLPPLVRTAGRARRVHGRAAAATRSTLSSSCPRRTPTARARRTRARRRLRADGAGDAVRRRDRQARRRASAASTVKAPRDPDETIDPDEPASDLEPLEGPASIRARPPRSSRSRGVASSATRLAPTDRCRGTCCRTVGQVRRALRRPSASAAWPPRTVPQARAARCRAAVAGPAGRRRTTRTASRSPGTPRGGRGAGASGSASGVATDRLQRADGRLPRLRSGRRTDRDPADRAADRRDRHSSTSGSSGASSAATRSARSQTLDALASKASRRRPRA